MTLPHTYVYDFGHNGHRAIKIGRKQLGPKSYGNVTRSYICAHEQDYNKCMYIVHL